LQALDLTEPAIRGPRRCGRQDCGRSRSGGRCFKTRASPGPRRPCCRACAERGCRCGSCARPGDRGPPPSRRARSGRCPPRGRCCRRGRWCVVDDLSRCGDFRPGEQHDLCLHGPHNYWEAKLNQENAEIDALILKMNGVMESDPEQHEEDVVTLQQMWLSTTETQKRRRTSLRGVRRSRGLSERCAERKPSTGRRSETDAQGEVVGWNAHGTATKLGPTTPLPGHLGAVHQRPDADPQAIGSPPTRPTAPVSPHAPSPWRAAPPLRWS
jgi:hypothetical protein